MLFLVKRDWRSSLLTLGLFLALGLAARPATGGVPWGFTGGNLLTGVAVFGAVLVSDGSLHGVFLLVFGEAYRKRQRGLAAVFRDQSWAALLAGALLAGLGEELVFRGLSAHPGYLLAGAVLFGLLHHVRQDLWPFTLWAVWQGVLLAGALHLFQALSVTAAAHFLHDLAGFLVFRRINRRS